MKTLTRKQIKEGLEQVPMADILGVSRKDLTPKQVAFAQEIARGTSKAEAYRTSHKRTASKTTLAAEPYRLAADPRIALEVEAYKLAIEAAKHRTPAALRELVIQSLVQVVIDPDAKQATKVQAAKVLGTVTEVAAFTERKEVHTITSSADTKAKIMGQLREMLKAGAEDATVIEADTLLKELAGETHPSATPQASQAESHLQLHTIPPESPVSELDPPPQENIPSVPTHSFREDTPG
jgi:G3E family GTPase